MTPLIIIPARGGSKGIPGKNIKPLENDTRITEFRKLNETVMRSIERNEKQYEQQKLFIANASHEMQTPLAVCAPSRVTVPAPVLASVAEPVRLVSRTS